MQRPEQVTCFRFSWVLIVYPVPVTLLNVGIFAVMSQYESSLGA
jgi:hypothetical protein